MFEIFRNQSKSAAGAIVYVTVGVLMIIWAGLWYCFYIYPVPNPPTWQKFMCIGTILSGVAIGGIGLLFGMIGRGAKGADTSVGVSTMGSTLPIAAATVSPNGSVVGPAPVMPAVSAVPPSVVSVNSAMPSEHR